MITDRSNTLPHPCHEFTLALGDAQALLFLRHIRELSAAVRTVQRRRRCRIPAFVVLPGRLHGICTLAPRDDFAACVAEMLEVFAACAAAGERARDFDVAALQRAAYAAVRGAERIHSADELLQRIARLHCAPVECGLVTRPALWPWSSYRREARAFRYAIAERDRVASRWHGVRDAAGAHVHYAALHRSSAARIATAA